MRVFHYDNRIVISDIKNFDCNHIFECGQCFRWSQTKANNYTGTAFGKTISVSFENENLTLEGSNKKDFEDIWKNYFDLDTDYQRINEEISKIHPVLAQYCKKFSGIRILRQEPWETLCSFIISQNNNIPRIKGIISKFCSIFGENLSFPDVKIVSKLTLEDLAPIKCGFRAKYILDAAKKVVSGKVDFETIKRISNEEARAELLKIYGVGQKVADCTLLFGFHRLDVFPVDVWIKRVMKKYFPDKTSDFFGKYGGVAQQYLFHGERNT